MSVLSSKLSARLRLRRHDLCERALERFSGFIAFELSSGFLKPLDLGLLSLWFRLWLCPWLLGHGASTPQLIV